MIKFVAGGPNPTGLCQCGCGQTTPLCKHARVDIRQGQYHRFLPYHHKRRTYDSNDGPNPSGMCQCGCGQKTSVAKATQNGVKRGQHNRYLRSHQPRVFVRTDGFKFCRGCKQDRDRSDFGPNLKNADRLEIFCRDCKNARARSHYADNKDAQREYFNAYRNDHPEVYQPSRMRRRALKLNQFIEDVDPVIVYEMHGGRCGICGEFIEGDFHVDHVIPLSKGGMHGYVNVQPAHPKCNLSKGAKVL
jgi:5-methylcytosine-specific restriction endonuclease McrA